jgi:glycosyltransferase involved in cell wall biosynthesis
MALNERQKNSNSYPLINGNQHLTKTHTELNSDQISTLTTKTMSNHKSSLISPLHSIEAVLPSKVSDTLYNKLTTLSVITEFFPPDYAATGQLIEELVKQLEKQGIMIRVFTGQPGYAFTTAKAPALEQLGNIRVQRSRSTQLWSKRIRGKAVNGVLFTLRTFLHIIKNARKNDVFLLTSAPPFLSIAGYFAHLLLKFPYICLIYDLYPDIAIALGVVSKKHWLAKFWWAVNRQIWQKSKGIIVLSPAMKERVIAICPEVADKVSVIHSWGDSELIVPIAKEKNWFAKQHNLDTKFTILYSGNMGRCHDTDTILATAQKLQEEPIQFVCIGGGPKRESFIQDVTRLGLKNFLFLPYQDKSVLPYSLTACDLSLVSVEAGLESLVAPSKLYPALAAGRPIAAICPKDSYLRQLIADGEFGISIDNGDSDSLSKFILNLKSDRQLAEKMGNASREYLQSNFTPEIIAKQYINVLEQAII